MAAQISFEHEPSTRPGLRDRKKVRTRQAIEAIALELFAEQGFEATTVEDICDRAEVSPTTFFRYFPNKADVVLSEQIERLPDLRQSIIDRPREESEIDALHNALQQEWVRHIDPVRTALTTRAITSSRVLRGLGQEIGQTWQVEVSEAIAKRRRLRKVDERSWLAATMALSVFGESVKRWVDGGCEGDLSKAVDKSFGTLRAISRDWG